MFALLSRSLFSSLSRTASLSRPMSSASAPAFKPFNLALIQLGQVGSDKDCT